MILVILNGLFYKACNGVLSHCSTADVFVKLRLVKAYCLPVLTYCIGALNLPVAKIKIRYDTIEEINVDSKAEYTA